MADTREDEKRLEAAKAAALEAGKLLLEAKTSEARSKGWHDFVTEMDVKSERLIVDHLSSRFPEDDFLGEESGGGTKRGAGLWIIDPIDGTANFILGIPCYTISIGYRNRAGELTAGVIYHPRQGELFWAGRGMGAYLNEKPIHVSLLKDPADANTIMTPHPRLHKEAPYYFDLMQRIFLASLDLRNFGSAALSMAYVASGRAEAFLQLGLKPYDIAAGMVILSEAGGRYSGFNKDEDVLETGNIVATNGLLHDWYVGQL